MRKATTGKKASSFSNNSLLQILNMGILRSCKISVTRYNFFLYLRIIDLIVGANGIVQDTYAFKELYF